MTEKRRLALPRYRGWKIVALVIIVEMLVYGTVVASFSFWTRDWMREFNVLRGPVVTASLGSLVVSALFAPIAGALTDKWSARGSIVAGLLCLGCGLCLITVSPNFPAFLLLFSLLLGMATALTGSPIIASTLAARWFPQRRGLMTSIMLLGLPLGGVLMPPLVTQLLSTYGWRTTALQIAAASFALLLPAYVLVADSPAAGESLDTGRAAARSFRDAPPADWSTKQLLASLPLWMILLALIPAYGATVVFGANFAGIAADRHLDASQAALAMSAICLVAMAAKVTIGRLADIFDCRRLTFWCLVALAAGFVLIVGEPAHVRTFAGITVIGMAGPSIALLQGVLAGRYFGIESIGRVVGLLQLFLLCGALAGPVAAAVRDYYGSFDPVLLAIGAIVPLSALGMFLLPRERP